MSANSKSIWEGTDNEQLSFPVLKGAEQADIAIIGAGITGLTAALLLAKEGKDVIVLEARQVGLGTTGNSTGNLYVTVDEHLSHLRSKWNTDVMRTIAAARAAAISLVETNVQKYNIDCDFSRQPMVLYTESGDKKHDDFLQRELDALLDCGMEASLSDNAGLPFKTHKALRLENQAQFHPLMYTRQLARSVSQKCKVYEHSRVLEIDEKEGIIKTGLGTVKANRILLATHTPVGVYAIHAMLAPYREFGVAARLNSEFPSGIFWGMDEPRHSIRSLQSEGKTYVMGIGDKFKTGQHGDAEEYVARVKAYLSERLPVSGFEFVWGGQQYRSADGLPYIGKHSDRMFFMTGFATDGLTYGTLAAMIVSDLLTDRPNPWEKTFSMDRFTPLKSARDFVVENADAVTEYLKDVPWNVDVKALEDIKPGDGKVIEREQQKWGVYRDNSGRIHAVSATCTHMKCIVNWNQRERTWDCPCHGSRFSLDGKVIEGPALTDLPGKTIE